MCTEIMVQKNTYLDSELQASDMVSTQRVIIIVAVVEASLAEGNHFLSENNIRMFILIPKRSYICSIQTSTKVRSR